MMCPKCKNSSLTKSQLKSKELVLDTCSQCQGVWFGKGELTTMLGPNAKQGFSIQKFAVKNPDTLCPKCNISLYECCYPGTLTLVDGCQQCEGIWLDNNEWSAISYARDESNKISCHSCHTRQSQAESCKNCGIIIAKFKTSDDLKKSLKADKKKSSADKDNISVQNYADDIPGLKGKLLRMIDTAVKNLTSYIRE